MGNYGDFAIKVLERRKAEVIAERDRVRREKREADALATANAAVQLQAQATTLGADVVAFQHEINGSIKPGVDESKVFVRELPQRNVVPRDITSPQMNSSPKENLLPRESNSSHGPAFPTRTGTSLQQPGATADNSFLSQNCGIPNTDDIAQQEPPTDKEPKDKERLDLQATALQDTFDLLEIKEEDFPSDEGEIDEDILDQERHNTEEREIASEISRNVQESIRVMQPAPGVARVPQKFVLTSARKRKLTDDYDGPAEPKLRTRKTYNANGSHQMEAPIAESSRPNSTTSKTKVAPISIEYLQPRAGTISSAVEFDLNNLCQIIEQYMVASMERNPLPPIRESVQRAMLAILPEQLPRNSSIYHKLTRAIGSAGFPLDVRRDLEMVVNRLKNGPSDGNLLRGIFIKRSKFADGTQRLWKVLDPRQNSQTRESKVIGANGLVNGQWWLERVDAVRDGAHGSREAGIYGLLGSGTFSIVIASSDYADRDDGDVIEYCGTEQKNKSNEPTTSTKYMEISRRSGQPIRVLRASGKKNSQYAPKEGIRYDGLYTITKHEMLNPDTALFRYTLERVANQDPIRYKGPEARPNPIELAQRQKVIDWVDTL